MRPIESMRSGAHTDGRYSSEPYPVGWRTPMPHRRDSPVEEAMRAAANHLVPDHE
ncbi:hypothetical protein [Mycolicibacterium hodleri]|uniref:hypothetical protein n=1 Tax=Mycolicibacterium hodleri TaxID=49897 RepID=UPI001375BE7B|nr:hypothetical protein [Mycolicibacterium hodleri]